MGWAGVAKPGDDENMRSLAGRGPARKMCAGTGVDIGSSMMVCPRVVRFEACLRMQSYLVVLSLVGPLPDA